MSPRAVLISLFLLFTLTICSVSFSQQDSTSVQTLPGKYKVISENGKITIPFELYRDKIRMTAKVNGRDCHLFIDNGSLWDELLFFGSPKMDSLALKYSGETVIGDSNVANPVRADIAPNVSLVFKDVVFTQQTAIVTRYDPRLPNLWEGTDGQVSATFFKHFVVRINFDQSVIELLRPAEFDDPGKRQSLTMKPGPHDSRTIRADIKMQDGSPTSIDLLVDLGGIYPLYLPVGKHDSIRLPKNAVESGLGVGFSRHEGFLGRVKSIKLGEYVLNDVVTAFTVVDKETDVYGNTMIGFPLLQRFNVTFDYSKSRLILEPSGAFDDPFKVNMTGMELLPDQLGNLRVAKVYPKSPADESGIRVNDVITHINGVKPSEYKAGEVRSILSEEGKQVTLDISREDQTLKCVVMRLQQIY
ncbi:MAG: PDZ domain-containing protein [Candidatus Zixiibacteriota bacterium]